MTDASLQTGPADAPYWEALADGKLKLQRCSKCDSWTWPAVWRCASCDSWDLHWEEVAIEGKLYSYTRTWHPFGEPAGYKSPFVSVLAYLPHAGNKRLLGVYEGDEDLLALDLPLVGRVDVTLFGGKEIPAIRWRNA